MSAPPIETTGVIAPPIVYLDFDGASLARGDRADPYMGLTPIVNGPVEVAPFDGSMFDTAGPGGLSPEVLRGVMRQLLAPFAIDIVEVPPAGGPYVHIVVGGRGVDLSELPEPQLLAEALCDSSAPGVIAVVLAEDLAPSATRLVAAIGQAVGRVFGLDQQSNNWGVMTGERLEGKELFFLPDSEREPPCGGRSYRDPREKLPVRVDAPPLSWVWPAPEVSVAPRFQVVVAPSSPLWDVPIALRVDGCLVDVVATPPYSFVIEVEDGRSTVHLEMAALVDDPALSRPVSADLRIAPDIPVEPWIHELEAALQPAADCPGIAHQWLPLLGAPISWRQRGDRCNEGAQCNSGLCAVGPSGGGQCMTRCVPDEPRSCPEPWVCVPWEGESVCAPSAQLQCEGSSMSLAGHRGVHRLAKQVSR